MRLSQTEIQTIKAEAWRAFGRGSRVLLFGSRVDDNRRGGDIDLYIEPEIQDNPFQQKIEMLSRLMALLGEQKIDIVVAGGSERLIDRQARATGVEL